MERRSSSSEKAAQVVGSALLLFALASCNASVAIDETHVWYGSEMMRNDSNVVAHETCHQKQMVKIGGDEIFWHKYWNKDNAFRCKAELDCGADESHFACSDFKFYIEDTRDKNTKYLPAD